jgi:hypothetical protein
VNDDGNDNDDDDDDDDDVDDIDDFFFSDTLAHSMSALSDIIDPCSTACLTDVISTLPRQRVTL